MHDAKKATDGSVVGMRNRSTVPQRTTVPITLDLDGTSFVTHGRHASDGTVVILTDAVVWTDGAPAARVMAFGAGNVARMLSARISQDMMPVHACASWDGMCWNLESILPEARAA